MTSRHLPRLGWRRLAIAAACAAAAAPAAHADFATAPCAGGPVTGRGSSLAADAHARWADVLASGPCAGPAPIVTFEPLGSGAGRRAMSARGEPVRFGMTDEAPGPAAVAAMNAGGDAAGDEGRLHVVPAAVAAVAALVNFPDGCDAGLLPEANRTAEQDLDADALPDGTVRVRFGAAQWAAAWTGDAGADAWTELFPTLAADPDCDAPLVRVVRFEDAGTTFNLKRYLGLADPSGGWTAATDSRSWPNAAIVARPDCGDAPGPSGPTLTSACAPGDPALVSALIATDGSIGYAGLGSARAAGLAVTPEAGGADTYWTQLEDGGGTFAEPTADPNGFRTDGAPGAGCADVTFSGVPASTLDDWSGVSAVGAAGGHPICTLTYGLLFDDHAAAWGASAAEERMARTVLDYWTAVVSDPGQAALAGGDDVPLPPEVLGVARRGVAEIAWQRDAAAPSPPPSSPPPSPGGDPGGPPAPPIAPPDVPEPDANFTITRRSVERHTGNLELRVRVPGAGGVRAAATATVPGRGGRQRSIAMDSTSVPARRAGTVKLVLRLSRAAKAALRATGRLPITVTIDFRRAGASVAATRRTTLTLRGVPKRARR